jgi:tetratricopeptide (TPR) repeat protein
MDELEELIDAGDAALAEGRLDDADMLYSAAAQAFPRRGVGFAGQMRVAQQRQEHARTTELAAKLLSLGVFQFAAHLALAKVHLARGHYALAEAAALEAAQLKPQKPGPRVLLIDIARMRGELLDRYEELVRDIGTLEDDFPVRVKLASGLCNFGRGDLALELVQGIELALLDDRRLFRLSTMYEGCGRPDLSDLALQGIDRSGEFGAFMLLSDALHGRLRPADAIRAFETAGIAHDRHFDALLAYTLNSGSIRDRLYAFRSRPLQHWLAATSVGRIASLWAEFSPARAYSGLPTVLQHRDLPLVSLVAPIHRADDQRNLVDQLLRQTYPRLEVIVIVNGKGLDPGHILRSLEASSRFERVVVQEHPETTSLPQSLNIGIAQARGDYIGRIDADDRYLEHYVERTVNLMLTHEADVCGKSHLFFYVESLNLTILLTTGRPEYTLRSPGLAYGSGSTLMVRRDVARALPFDERLRSGEDRNFYDRARAAGYSTILAPPFDHIVIRRADKEGHTWGLGDVHAVHNATQAIAYGSLSRVEKIMRMAEQEHDLRT